MTTSVAEITCETNPGVLSSHTPLKQIGFNRLSMGLQSSNDDELKKQCNILTKYIDEGIYTPLPRRLKAISRKYRGDKTKIKDDEYNIHNAIDTLLKEYKTLDNEQRNNNRDISDPQIIISETFV